MHIQSMTGFGQSQAANSAGSVSAELRSVNNRFLDLSLRIPEDLRHLETSIRDRVARRIPRGKIELRMSIQRDHGPRGAPNIDHGLVAELLRIQQTIAQEHPGQVAPWSAAELLRWPGVLADDGLAEEAWDALAMQAIDAALTDFEAARTREGARLAEVMLARLADMEGQLRLAAEHLPRIHRAVCDKVAERLREALSGIHGAEADAVLADRIRAEAQAAALRADVGEEMDRLQSHIAEMRRILQSPTEASVGKRLDFLAQELHREANTFGSKSASIVSTQMAIELKLAVEQIREQVQNIQ